MRPGRFVGRLLRCRRLWGCLWMIASPSVAGEAEVAQVMEPRTTPLSALAHLETVRMVEAAGRQDFLGAIWRAVEEEAVVELRVRSL